MLVEFCKLRFIVFLLVLSGIGWSVKAQHTLEFIQNGTYNSYKPPVPKGPTSIPQTLKFFMNHNGSVDDSVRYRESVPPLSVTFSFDDQPYITVPQHITGMTFGAVSGASSSNVKSVSVINKSYYLNDSSQIIFTAHPEKNPGHGIDFSDNVGLQIFLSAKPLISSNAPKTDSSRYYYGKLRLQFSRPVDNPVISLVGLGATTNFGNSHLGFATELELQTPSLTVSKLSGSKEMLIDDTKTKILHTRTNITGNCEDGAACGSVVINGTQINNIVFSVYLRADGGPGIWGSEKVTNSGDGWHIMVSLAGQ